MGDRVDAITYKTDVKSRVGDSISEKRDAITGKVSNLVSGVTGKASDISDQAPSGDELKGHATRAAGVAKDNPLGLALGAVAVGFLVGLAVPATRIEDERLGQASDTIKQKAMETGQEALNRGQQVAKDVAQSAAQTARESGGQHASELADTAKENASEAKQGAQSSIQSQSQG